MKHISHLVWFFAVLVAFFVGKGMTGSSGDGGREDAVRLAADPRIVQEDGAVLTALDDSGDTRDASGIAQLFAKPVIAKEAVEDVLGKALRETDPLLRKQQIATILAGLDAANVAAALAAFEAGPRGGEHDVAFRDFVHAWARIDGAGAIAYVMDPKSPRRDHYAGSSAMSGWAMTDSEAAKDYVAGVENNHAKEWLHAGVVEGMINTDIDAAVEFSEQNKLGRARGRQMDRLADRFYETGGSEAVMKWLNGIDHTGENEMLPYKRYSAKVAMERIARDDPGRAREWIEANASMPFVSGEAVASVARRAAGEKVAERLDWIGALPEGEARGDAFSTEIRSWAGRDANAAGEWLGANQNLPDYDQAARAFAGQVAGKDPESALAWAGTIKDSRLQQETVGRLLADWRKRAPGAAAQWSEGNRPQR